MADPTIETSPAMDGAVERPPSFLATPEKVSDVTELQTEEVMTELKSVEGRQRLFDQIMAKEALVRQVHPDFDPEELRTQLDSAGEALAAQEKYLEDMKSPEKKGLFSRAWETIKKYKKTAIIASIVALVLLVAGGMYMGWIPTSLGWVGSGGWFGAGEAAAEGAGEAAAGAAEVVGGTAAEGAGLTIETAGHSIIYKGVEYTAEQFEQILPSALEGKGEGVINILQNASSRATIEDQLGQLLTKHGVQPQDVEWIFKPAIPAK